MIVSNMKEEFCNLVVCYSKIDKLHEQERQLWMNELKLLVEKNGLLQETIRTRVFDETDCPEEYVQQIKDLQDSNESYKNFYKVMKSAMETNTSTIQELQESQISLYKKILCNEKNSNPTEPTWSHVEEKLECDPLSNQQAIKNATYSETTAEESPFQDVGRTSPSFLDEDQGNKDQFEHARNNYESQPQKYGVPDIRIVIDKVTRAEVQENEEVSFCEENRILKLRILDLEKLSSEKSEEVGELKAQIEGLKRVNSFPRIDPFLEGENRALKAKILDLEKQSSQDAKEVAKLAAYNDGLKHENTLLKENYYSGEESKKQKSKKPSSENAELSDVTSNIEEMVDESILSTTPFLEFSKLDESAKTQMLMKIISSKKAVNDELRSQISVLKKELGRVKAQAEDIDSSTIKQLESKVEDLQSELISKNTEITQLKSRNRESSNRISDLSEQVDSKDDFIKLLEAQLSQVGDVKETMTLNSEPTLVFLAEKSQNSQKESAESEQAANVQAYLQGKVDELCNKVAQNEETISGLTSKLEAKNTENEKLENLLNVAEGRYEKLKEDFDSQTRVYKWENLINGKDKLIEEQTVRLSSSDECEDLKGRFPEAESQSQVTCLKNLTISDETNENQGLLESGLGSRELDVKANDGEIKELSDVANTCKNDLSAENRRLNWLYEESVVSSKRLEAELGDKNKQINFLSETFSGEIDKVSESVQKIKEELVRIKEEQEGKDIEMAGIYKQYGSLTTETENLLKSKFKLEDELAAVRQDIETKSPQGKGREDLILVETEATSNLFMSKPPQKNTLEGDNSVLVKYLETIRQLEVVNKSLTSKVEDLERDLLESKICEENSQNKVKTMKKELGDRDEELKTLKANIEVQIEEILSAKKTAMNQNSTFNALKTLIECKETEIDSMGENILKLEGNLSEKSDEVERLKDLLESSNEETSLMRDVLDNKDDEVKVLRDSARGQSEEIERLTADLANKAENIRLLEDTLNSRYLETKKLERDLKNAEEELESLKNCLRSQETARMEEHDVEIQSMRDRLDAKDNEIECLRNNLEDVDGEIQLLKGNLVAREDEINTLRGQLDKVGDQETQVEKILNEYNQLKVDYENYVKRHEQTEDDLKTEIIKNAEMSSTLRRQESALKKSMNINFEYPPSSELDDKLSISESIILQSINFLRGREKTPDDSIRKTSSVQRSTN